MDGTKYYNANFVFDKQKEMDYILFDEGRIVNYGGNLEYEYHIKDHLGSVRVAFVPTTSGTEIVQENAYYPFGGTIGDFSYNESENRYKHTGMEAIDDFGLNMLDNNARWRDVSAVPRFYAIDPLAEKYYSLSPYAYCGNNPVNRIDPTGMEIKYDEEGYNRGVWLNHLIMLLLHTMWYEQNNKNGKYDEQIAIMMQTIYSMEAMEASPQVYRLENGAKKSKLFYDKETGEMVVRYNGLALFAHEVTHGGQFENREIGFNENGNGYAIDIHNEVDAFKAQWAVDPATVDNLKSAKKITPKYVQNMVENGKKPYKPNGENNTAIAPINLNSTRDDIIKAYPHLKNELQTLPANVTLMTILPAIYYNGKYEKK